MNTGHPTKNRYWLIISSVICLNLVCGLARGAAYDGDSRVQLNALAPDVAKLGRSVVTLVRATEFQNKDADGYRLTLQAHGELEHLCPGQKFAGEKKLKVAYCSGVLVAPDVILAQDECFDKEDTCANTRFLFDYLPGLTVAKNQNVYSCGKVLATETDEHKSTYLLIQLDRKVEGRDPVPWRRSGLATTGDQVVMIGSSDGLPLKAASGVVKYVDPKTGRMSTNLTAFDGNAGSPVFSAKTHLLEGILNTGESDYVQTKDGCQRVNVIRSKQSQFNYENGSTVGSTADMLGLKDLPKSSSDMQQVPAQH